MSHGVNEVITSKTIHLAQTHAPRNVKQLVAEKGPQRRYSRPVPVNSRLEKGCNEILAEIPYPHSKQNKISRFCGKSSCLLSLQQSRNNWIRISCLSGPWLQPPWWMAVEASDCKEGCKIWLCNTTVRSNQKSPRVPPAIHGLNCVSECKGWRNCLPSHLALSVQERQYILTM